jgi:membrane carboxypeptidase/penicillin-binding protein PbpC
MLHDQAEPQEFKQPKELNEVEICALSGKKRGPHCPYGVKELFLRQDLEKNGLAPCNVHCRLLVRNDELAGPSNEYRVFEDLPPVYESWQRQANRPMAARETSQYADNNLFEIVRPASGSLYKRPLDLAPAYQTLRFEAIGAPARAVVIWSLNGHEVGRTNDRHYLDWNVQTGSFVLRAETREGQISEVTFSVD